MDERQDRGDAMKTALQLNGKPLTLENLARKRQEISFTLGKKEYRFRGVTLPDGGFLLEQEIAPGVWQRETGIVSPAGREGKRIQLGGIEAKIGEPRGGGMQESEAGALSPMAPMPGLVRQILVKKGDKVAGGQPLAVMEAMKLQMTLAAGGDAIVDAVLVKEGDMVAEGAELVRLTPLETKAA
jgi:biotin carboxyl carrier protein